MKSRRSFKLGGVATSVSVAVMLASLYSIGEITKAQPAQPCCVDRWDPARMERGRWGPGRMGEGQRQRMARHWAFMHEGVPTEYRGQTNPFESSADAVDEGRELYATHCELCHGSEGLGDGQIANSLNPSPALLAHLIQMPIAVDEYLLWSISEGGTEFDTSMPAFGEVLSREQIWKTISFLRAGLPPASDGSTD